MTPWLRILSLLLVAFHGSSLAWAEDEPAEDASNGSTEVADEEATEPGEIMATTGNGEGASSGNGSGNSNASTRAAAAVATAMKDAESLDGLFHLWRKNGHVYTELKSEHYRNEYILIQSIARGIGQQPLLGGMSWDNGNDAIWVFRKVNNRIHIVRKNVRFRADRGSPEATAVEYAYTDSVLFSLPIIGKGPGNGDFVDLTTIFMSDLPGIQNVLSGYSFSTSKSSWASVKSFSDNIELEVAATYASNGRTEIETVPDSRGLTINIHYSFSKIPSTEYKPRMADPRVGYFITAVKDYSLESNTDEFVRYIERWQLEKANSSLDISPPKEPIIFWIENTVPYEFREPIREGILEWNKAFEKVGFQSAIEVRQQPADADWDPEDINYNTFRWITSSAGFAMGPSRVNPYTGQILDADIIFDAHFLMYWRDDFEVIGPRPQDEGNGDNEARSPFRSTGLSEICSLQRGMSEQLAFGMSAIMARNSGEASEEMQRQMLMAALREVAMHEVGHTLGLRHNFKASTYHSLAQQNDPEADQSEALSASVMDYLATNIVPEDWHQGPYFTPTIGVYDYWAIEYGYKPIPGNAKAELQELQEIAARSGEAGLAYATDGDTESTDPDPHANRFDNGKDLIAFANMRAELVAGLMPDLVDRMVAEGEGYQGARRAFNLLLARHGQAMVFASRYIGGIYVNRSHRGDEDAPAPMVVVDVEKQREAMGLLEEQVFSDTPYQVPPEVYNHLAPTMWSHWGVTQTARADFPVHDVISQWQARVLAQLLSSTTLERLHDSELKVPAEEDAFTVAELFDRLTRSIYSEVENLQPGEYTNRQPAISSIRRNLQRIYLESLSNIAMGQMSAPEDCQSIVVMEITLLHSRIETLLERDIELDNYTRAHLTEVANRISKVLKARYVLPSP